MGILIIDCGATKSAWAFVSEDGIRYSTNSGYHPLTFNEDFHVQTIRDWSQKTPIPRDIEKIEFYGTGCIGPQANERVKGLFLSMGYSKAVDVHSDLQLCLNAAKTKEASIIGILGTGSNTCVYDGYKVLDHIPSLGMNFGDFGSGYDIGKRLIQKMFSRQLPPEMTKAILYGKTLEEYRQELFASNDVKYLVASLCVKLNPIFDFTETIEEAFQDFFSYNILPYNRTCPIYLFGSIAFHFSNSVHKIGKQYGFNQIFTIDSPLEYYIRQIDDLRV